MPVKETAFVFVARQEYMRHTNGHPREMNVIFESISNSYIPLLNMFESLERDGVPFKMNVVLQPLLCSLLTDPVVQNAYIDWLDERIALGMKELKRCGKNKKIVDTIKLTLEKLQENKIDFTIRYNQNLVGAFAAFAKKGCIELLGTTGTPLFLPHYADCAELINAQIETGLKAHRYFFGTVPAGFWLPEMGYSSGLESFIKSYGLDYTLLDGQSVLFSDVEPRCGIFAPARFGNSLGILARANWVDDALFGAEGYAANSVYCDRERDIGFSVEREDLAPYMQSVRYTTGYGYWNKRSASVKNAAENSADDDIYEVDAAVFQCEQDAAHFTDSVRDKLAAAEKLLPDEESVSLICVFNARQLETWSESMIWLERTIRRFAGTELPLVCTNDLFLQRELAQKIRPYMGAWCGDGFGENLLSSKNSWMIRYVRKAGERMVDLAERFPRDTGIKARLLNLGAKELLLAQSSGWPALVDNDMLPEYAAEQFSDAILGFTKVYEALGSNTVSTEWLTELEARHPIFPWMNYRIFSKKR